MPMLTLRYDRGTIVLSQEGEGRRSDELVKYGSKLPVWLKWDGDRCLYRTLAYKYRELAGVLNKLGIEFADEVMNPLDCPKLSAEVQLYDFQEDALDAWSKKRAGSLVIPTGGGKTIVAMRAIADLNASTLVIAPTLELVGQWMRRMEGLFGIPIGKYTGDEKVLEPLTVATYDTAYLRAQELGDRFMLVVFDEAHHLAAPGYLQIAEMLAAPWRMGLTATYEREDKLHLKLDAVLGGKVYEISLDALRGKHLSDFVTKKIVVSLLPK
jgi:superfamily II DNA or RNA helicase